MKLKSLLQETKVWERKFGESLPTLEDTTKAFKLKKEQDEKDKPEHFGGGENIDILGYQTKHYDICRSAVILYNKLKEKSNDESKELTIIGLSTVSTSMILLGVVTICNALFILNSICF